MSGNPSAGRGRAAARGGEDHALAKGSTCRHCRVPVGAGQAFCCGGCAAAYGILRDAGLLAYYDLAPLPRPGESAPAIADEVAPLAAAGDHLSLAIDGIHCSACVWLCEALYAREPGAKSIRINPARGAVDMTFDAARFSPAVFAQKLGRFGYRLGPKATDDAAASQSLLARLAVCAALTSNSMIFSFAFYFGLSPSEGALYRVLSWVNAAVATAVVLVGGAYFGRTAVANLRSRVVHLDVPIAFGIGLGYVGSLAIFLTRGGAAYFDTVCGFVTLMLVGKYLPERVLERNRRRLGDEQDVAALEVRRREGDAICRVPAREIRAGDRLLFAPGELVAVDVVSDLPASCSLDWLTGEPDPRAFAAKETIPAGAFNLARAPLEGVAETDFARSALKTLTPAPTYLREQAQDAWVTAFARYYVPAVLAIALATFAYWLGRDLDTAFLAAVAVLIVSCPCAIGLATPLAYEVIVSRLRSRGVYVRSPRALRRLAEIDTVAFDKTGTLGFRALTAADRQALQSLAPAERAALKALVAVSNHPHARALDAAVELAATTPAALDVEETVSAGVAGKGAGGAIYRLGRAAFAAPGADMSNAGRRDRTWFSVDGKMRASFELTEQPHEDCARDVAALRAQGYALALLSGDSACRTHAMGQRAGLVHQECKGRLLPEQKAAWVTKRGRKTLMVGDGVNDLLAFAAAHAAATPAEARPIVPARADFYYLGRGLAPVRAALKAARGFARVARFNYGFAFAYNLIVLSLAASGRMTPLIAAFTMPLSSVTIVVLNIAAARRAA